MMSILGILIILRRAMREDGKVSPYNAKLKASHS
jgi:putative membrane protein